MNIKNYFIEDYWEIGIIEKSITEFLLDDFFNEINIINTPKSYFLADPFWSKNCGTNKLYCEQFNFKTQKGVISEVEINEDYKLVNKKVLLELNTHLSFPFILEIDNSTYLIPENADNGNLKLWDLKKMESKTLKKGNIVDPVIFENNGIWYLFCSILDSTENKTCHLYFTRNKELQQWKTHPCSPIQKTINGSRMAGSIIQSNEKLYRIAQNCEKEYGGGLSIYEITELSNTSYHEKFQKTIYPPKGYKGIHTLNTFGNRTLVDLKKQRFSILKPFQRFKKKYL